MSDKLASVATNFDKMEFMDQDYECGDERGFGSNLLGWDHVGWTCVDADFNLG
jgi:hypothetical protein